MPIPTDLESLSPPVRKILGAPAKMQAMAARGIVPGLKPADIATIVALLTEHDDAEIAKAAADALPKLPPPVITGALGADLEPIVIQKLASANLGKIEVLEKLIRMKRVDVATLTLLAERADEKLGEIIATNEARLLEFPVVIEKLYMNKRVRMSTADRLLELAVRNGIELDIPAYAEAAAAIRNELIPEPSEEPTPDDILFQEAQELAAAVGASIDEDTHEPDDEGTEHVKSKFLQPWEAWQKMTVTQKIRAAVIGDSDVKGASGAVLRGFAIRETNRLIQMAAVRSPLLREDEVVRISANRSVTEEVLRVIARNREHTRSYQVKLNLVQNPHTPFMYASQFITHLRDNDLRALSKSKNVPSNVQAAVRRQLLRKQSGKA